MTVKVYHGSCPKCKTGSVEVDFAEREAQCLHCGFSRYVVRGAQSRQCPGSGGGYALGSLNSTSYVVRIREGYSYMRTDLLGECRVCCRRFKVRRMDMTIVAHER